MDQNSHDSVFNNETSQFLRIPLNRIGAVIGLKGSSKNQIEELTSTKIIIDSETGEKSPDVQMKRLTLLKPPVNQAERNK